MVIRKNTESATANEVPEQDADPVEWAVWLVHAFPGLKIAPVDHGTNEADYGSDANKDSWPYHLSDKPNVIRGWDKHYRRKTGKPANFLVCPGDRYVILDLDRKPGGADGIGLWENLAGEHDDMDTAFGDPTFKVTSPSGGEHRYYAVDEPKSNANRFPGGIDVRGCGGYGLVPNSVGANGRYRAGVQGEPVIAPLPQWAGTYMRRKGERRNPDDAEPIGELDHPSSIERARTWLNRREPAIAGEQNAKGKYGDEWTFETCCYLRDFGLTYPTALDLLTEPDGWNDRCQPPWDYGPEAERRDDIEVKLGSAYRNAQNRPGERTGDPAVQFGDPPTDAADAPHGPSGDDGDDVPDETAKPDLSNVVFYWGMQLAERGQHTRYVIDQFLPWKGITALLAKRGTGKSLTLLQVAAAIARDDPWMGQSIMKGYNVLYIAAEDDGGVELMLRGWAKHTGQTLPEDRFAAVADFPNLVDTDAVDAWVELLERELKGKPTVLVVDTWQRVTAGAGQSEDAAMGVAIRNLERLGKAADGPVLSAFHPPKHGDATILGASMIENSTHSIWELTGENVKGADLELEVTRIKGTAKGAFKLLNVKEVDLGVNTEHGRPLTAAVVEHVSGSEAELRESKALRDRRNALRRAMAWAPQVARMVFGVDRQTDDGHEFTAPEVAKRLIERDAKAQYIEEGPGAQKLRDDQTFQAVQLNEKGKAPEKAVKYLKRIFEDVGWVPTEEAPDDNGKMFAIRWAVEKSKPHFETGKRPAKDLPTPESLFGTVDDTSDEIGDPDKEST